MTTDNQRTTRLQLREHRTDAGDADAHVMGFKDPHGLPRAVPGDLETAWLKAPPFTTPAQLLLERTAVPLASVAYAAAPQIEVADVRIVTLYLQHIVTDVGQLSIVPEAQIGLSGAFVPIAVIDLTPTAVTIGAPFNVPGIARTVAPSRLDLPALAAPGTLSIALSFDVSGLEVFRFSYADLDDNATTPLLNAWFSLSQ